MQSRSPLAGHGDLKLRPRPSGAAPFQRWVNEESRHRRPRFKVERVVQPNKSDPVTTREPRLLYSLDRERSYHFVTFVLVVFAIALGWLAWTMTEQAMVAEFGSVLGGRAAQGVMAVIGVAPLLTWLWWMRRYVRCIRWLPVTQDIHLTRFGYIGRRTWQLPLSAFVRATAHKGHLDIPGAPTVRAPYRRLHIHGLPRLILDDQGTVHDRRALDAILAGRPPGSAGSAKRAD
ncbi:MAG TPA: hypothetical protein VHF69_01875 [Candidatus Synoicihabitans sp.]|nr:hypothetical protein [Candidatus Synoicihabitans sp.]